MPLWMTCEKRTGVSKICHVYRRRKVSRLFFGGKGEKSAADKASVC